MENDLDEIKIDVGEEDFEKKVIEKSKEILVIVDFWAEWCMPCLILGPILEKITEEHKGKIILTKLNVDKNPEISRKYRIMSIPAIKIFKNGKIVNEFVGVLPEHIVREYIKKSLNNQNI